MTKNMKVVLGILGVILLGFILWYFSSLIIYLVISAILSIIGAPLVRRLKKIKIGYIHISSGVAAFITLLLFIGVVTLLFSIFAPLVAEEAELISKIDVENTGEQLKGKLSETEKWLEQFNLSGDERSNKEFVVEELQSLINFGRISDIFDNFFGVLGNAFAALFSIIFMTFFLLKDGYLLPKFVITLTPPKHLDRIKNIQERTYELMSSYLLGILTQVAITSTIVTLGLFLIGVENALIIGLLAGIMNLIPYVGPIIGMIIGVLVALTTNFTPDATETLGNIVTKVLVVFAIAQLVDNFFTQPFVLGKSVQAHPLEIFIVISAAATIAGIGGMVVAIPLYTILKIVAREFLSGFRVVETFTRGVD